LEMNHVFCSVALIVAGSADRAGGNIPSPADNCRSPLGLRWLAPAAHGARLLGQTWVKRRVDPAYSEKPPRAICHSPQSTALLAQDDIAAFAQYVAGNADVGRTELIASD
jgi:hypothetical protein